MCEICRTYLGLAVTESPAFAPAVVSRGGNPTSNGKTSLTTEQAAEQLTRSSVGWGGGLGAGSSVTFAFRSTAPTQMPEDTAGFTRFSAAQIAATLLALQGWSDVANVVFARIGDGQGDFAYSNNATILFGNYSSGESGAAAFAYFPGSRFPQFSAGDVWVNASLSANQDVVLGGYGAQILAHEIGHAIGISHPGSYGAGSGTPATYENNAGYYEDSRQYTVMSYFASTNTGASLANFAATPQLDDIAAAQRLYGANMNTRLEDNTYGFNNNTERPWFTATAGQSAPVFSVWDAGGVDTLDFSGYTQVQRIDLREGAFSDVGGSRYNVSVALGAVIENAKGGTAADVVTGNAAANRLEGLDGADALYGLAADDQLLGGAGDDVLDGGLGGDQLDGGEGVDIAAYEDSDGVTAFLGAPGLNTGEGAGDVYASIEGLTGGRGADLLFGHTGDDQLRGGDGSDWLIGGAGEDWLQGGFGADLLIGGAGRDLLDGGPGADVAGYMYATSRVSVSLAFPLSGNAGEAAGDTFVGIESVWGSSFDDQLAGDGGDNQLKGFDGDDILLGDGGADDLYGGRGRDVMNGGPGSDTFFYLDAAEGLDYLGTAFELGVDRIIVSRYWFGLQAQEFGAIVGQQLISGPGARATAAAPTFLYDSTTGLLSFDADGTGSGAAVSLAELAPGLDFRARDLWVST